MGDHVRVADVAKDSAIANYDVQIGDRIFAVNGKKGNDEELMHFLQHSQAIVSFEVRREANERIDFRDATNLAMHAQRQAKVLDLKPLATTNYKNAAHVIHSQGVAKLEQILSPKLASQLLHFVLKQQSQSDDTESFSKGLFAQRASTNAPKTRFEYRLPDNEPIVQDMMCALFQHASPLRNILQATIGPQATLWELSVIVSLPGAQPQIFHADTPYQPNQRLFTTFVALQDIALNMGPTSFLPSTHNDLAAHASFAQDAVSFLSQQTNGRSGVMDCGDATIYDSRLIHCGGANRSDKARALLCLTFKSPQEQEVASLSAPSIRSSLLNCNYSLQDLTTVFSPSSSR